MEFIFKGFSLFLIVTSAHYFVSLPSSSSSLNAPHCRISASICSAWCFELLVSPCNGWSAFCMSLYCFLRKYSELQFEFGHSASYSLTTFWEQFFFSRSCLYSRACSSLSHTWLFSRFCFADCQHRYGKVCYFVTCKIWQSTFVHSHANSFPHRVVMTVSCDHTWNE